MAVRRNRRRLRPIYFTELTIENLRCFGQKQTLDLRSGGDGPARWTVILGANGSGKTTLLRALAAFNSQQESTQRLDAIRNRMIFRRRGTGKSTASTTLTTNVDLERDGNAKRETLTLGVDYENYELLFRPVKVTLSSESLKGVDLPIRVAGYAATRKLVPGDLTDNASDDPVASLFSNAVTLRDPQSWLLQLHYAALRRRRGTKGGPTLIEARLARVEKGLIRLLPDISDVRITASRTSETSKVQFNTADGWIDIEELSLGYQTFAAWAADFANRLFEWYPSSADPMSQPAICLVDEIDLHMHPAWQRAVMDQLSEIFPRTQFVATAHSPLVVQAAAGANLVVLRRQGNEVLIDNNPGVVAGWRIDQILTSDLFGLESARPPEIEAAMKERVALLQKRRLNAAQRRRLGELSRTAETIPTALSTEYAESIALIRAAADSIRRKRTSRG